MGGPATEPLLGMLLAATSHATTNARAVELKALADVALRARDAGLVGGTRVPPVV